MGRDPCFVAAQHVGSRAAALPSFSPVLCSTCTHCKHGRGVAPELYLPSSSLRSNSFDTRFLRRRVFLSSRSFQKSSISPLIGEGLQIEALAKRNPARGFGGEESEEAEVKAQTITLSSNDFTLEDGPDDTDGADTDSAPLNPAIAARRTKLLSFVCKICNTRVTKQVNPLALEKGTVLVTCPSCENRHAMADSLGVLGYGIGMNEMAALAGEIIKTEGTSKEVLREVLSSYLKARRDGQSVEAAQKSAKANLPSPPSEDQPSSPNSADSASAE